METVRISCDLLVLGGGAAGCMAAVEAREKRPDLDVVVLEKAHVYRSGCLAAGISALNAYLCPGETPRSFLDYVRKDSCDVVRDDLVLSMCEVLNEQVHRVERWGLPIPRDEKGDFLQRGRASIKIFGERLKPLLGRAAEKSGARIFNRVNVTSLAVHGGRVTGAYGFGVRDGRLYDVSARAVVVATGGAAGIYRPNNPGAARSRMWYSPYNTGAGLAMGIRAGAEMTSFEMRFIPLRIKDAIAPTGEIAQWLKAPQINARGEKYLEKYYRRLGGAKAKTQDRLLATVLEQRAGRGPCYLDLSGVDPKRLEWTIPAYLSMAPAAALVFADEASHGSAGGDMAPVEICGGEPHVVGGHGLAGYWVDVGRRTSLSGLYAAGDVAGGLPKKYASGAWAEAVLAVRAAIGDLARLAEVEPDSAEREREAARVFAPLAKGEGVLPLELEERLQKVMDEYAGGISVGYGCGEGELRLARLHLDRMAPALETLRATSTYELMHCHEVVDRWTVARTLVEHMIHRRETRWSCYQSRLDFPNRDDARWMVFVNSARDARTGEIRMIERPVVREEAA
jgi:adenylylsulfate reductase subunit A